MKRQVVIVLLCLLLSLPVLLGGCEGMTPTQQGAVGGAAVGAVGGALIGGGTKSALIGAGAGALGGALLNDALSKG
jgi:osmotically inducible lipoprotein OsmB